MTFYVMTRRRIGATDHCRLRWSYRQFRALGAMTTAHIHCICLPKWIVCMDCHAVHPGEHGSRNHGGINSLLEKFGFKGLQNHISYLRGHIRIPIFRFHVCRNMSWGAKSGLSVPGSQFMTHYLYLTSNYEFIVTPRTNIHIDVNKSYCNLLVISMKRSVLVMLTN